MERKIIIVDDSDSIRELLSLILKKQGFDVIIAVNGNDALNKVDEEKIEMVITDLDMPVMDGIEFIKQLRNKTGHKRTPIVVLSSEDLEFRKLEMEHARVSDWIQKPFEARHLIDVVRRGFQHQNELPRAYAH